MKIYTRTGDRGQTGLFGGARVPKNDPRVEAYGTVDELNAALGLVRSFELSAELEAGICQMQKDLFTLGAEVACEPGKEERLKMTLVGSPQIEALERLIDQTEESLPPLTSFILPSGSPAGSSLHLARTIARRAERRCLELTELREEVIVYLNRLSDTLFVLARAANQTDNAAETPWSGLASKKD